MPPNLYSYQLLPSDRCFPSNHKTTYKALFLLCLLLCLPACSSKDISTSESGTFFKKIFSRDTYRIYRIDIQQGNKLTQQQLKRLTLGMTKEQVKFLLGSPVTPTLFHDDRWDYIYSFVSGTTSKRKKSHFTLLFKENELVEILKKTKKTHK